MTAAQLYLEPPTISLPCQFYIFLGGWASGSCPHNRIYAIKFVLRSEGPQDYCDLLRSFKYLPTINVSDIPNHLATLANQVTPNFFAPNDGQWFPSTLENVTMASEGKLQKQLEWTYVLANTAVDQNVHPVTGTTEWYSLYDRFHEKNSYNPFDVLRRLTLCPQIHTNINSESHEQLHQVFNKDNYFLNLWSVFLSTSKTKKESAREDKTGSCHEKKWCNWANGIGWDGQIDDQLWDDQRR